MGFLLEGTTSLLLSCEWISYRTIVEILQLFLLIVCHKVGNQIQLQHVLVIGRRIVADNLQELIDTVASRLVLLFCLYLYHNLGKDIHNIR